MITTLAELKAEYVNWISGKTLTEYLRTPRIGAKVKLTRKQKAGLYKAVQKSLDMPKWSEFFLGPKKATFDKETYRIEGAILKAQELY